MASMYHRDWSPQEILQRVGHMDQVAKIKLVEAADGMERGKNHKGGFYVLFRR